MGFRLHRMYKVGEFIGILDKKYRHIIANEVKDPFLRIKFYGEPTNVARKVS